MPKKRGPGRPALPDGEALDAVLRLRMREADKAELEAAGRRDGRGVSAWAREILLAAARRTGR